MVSRGPAPDPVEEERPHPTAERTARRALRWAALALLLQAAAALEIDPYHAVRATGPVELPGRAGVLASAAALALGALLVLRWPRPGLATVVLVPGAGALVLSTPHGSAAFHVLQALLLALAVLALAFALAHRGPHARPATRLLLVALVPCLLEAAFATVARSHAVGYTLAARLWFARHWSPPSNSLGFRDVERREDGRSDLFVLGDSFVSGVGIADVAERFGERLASALGEHWQVHNLGYNGTDTRGQLEVLARVPFTPEALVLSYYTNDIAGAGVAAEEGWPRYRPYRDLGRAAWLVSRSYTLDYLYWRLPRADLAAEGRFLAHCYEVPAVVAAHERELEALVAAARARTGVVVALLFPELTAPEASAAFLEPARRVYARLGVPIVEVAPLLADLTPAERVVNENDAHPSAAVHARVAEALASKLRELGLAR